MILGACGLCEPIAEREGLGLVTIQKVSIFETKTTGVANRADVSCSGDKIANTGIAKTGEFA